MPTASAPPKRAAPAKKAAPAFDVTAVRRQFPALRQRVNGMIPAYFDNPGGTQVPTRVLDAMRDYLIEANSNCHGPFHTSERTDQMIAAARGAMADFLNAPLPNQIVFGANMTTLTFHLSRSIGQTLSRGDQVLLTHMDHDANVSPWLLIARDQGLKVKWVDFDPKTGRLDLTGLERAITPKTRLIACGYASNALGTINDVKRIAELARAAGALVWVDAVHYAPHGPIDVQALGVDFLVCSAYKFFGPHVGILYGKREHLEGLPAYKVRPAPDDGPDRWETGTKNHEGLAGTTAAVEYLDWVGEQFGKPYAEQTKGYKGRRRRLKQAMMAIRDYEKTLSRDLLDGLTSIPNVQMAGIADDLDSRAPTFIFTVKGKTPAQVAGELGKQGIYVWDGDYYALEVMKTLGRDEHGGMVRVGAAHYNTSREVSRFLAALEQIARNGLKIVAGGNGKPAAANGKPQAEKARPASRAPARKPVKSARGGSPGGRGA